MQEECVPHNHGHEYPAYVSDEYYDEYHQNARNPDLPDKNRHYIGRLPVKFDFLQISDTS